MKKQLLVAILAASITVSSCKKKSNDDNTDDPFKLEYSNLTTEQHKQELENSGIAFVEKINSLPDEKFIDVFEYFADLDLDGLELDQVNNVLTISQASSKKDINSIFSAAVSTSTEKISDYYGIYTWNAGTEEWDETASSEKLEIRFPSSETSTTNNAVLTLRYESSNIIATLDGEQGELPKNVTSTLTVDGKEELKLTSSHEYKTDGTPIKTEVNLVLGAFLFKTSVNNTGTSLTSEVSFSKGTDKLFSLNSSANGNTTVGALNDNDDIETIIKNANTTFEIMNIKFAGMVDVKAIRDSENSWGNISEVERSKKEAEALNTYSKFVAINTSNNSLIAKVEFAPTTEEYCYSNSQQTICETEYSTEPRLVFKDGSKLSMETFTENGFDRLIDEVEDFESKFD